MMRIYMATPRYVQGPGTIDRIGVETRPFGARPAIILDAGIAEQLEPRIAAAMTEAGCAATIHPHGAEVQAATLDALAHALRRSTPDVVVGVGGGKALDTAKGVAIRLDLPMVAVPTIADTVHLDHIKTHYYASHRDLNPCGIVPVGPDLPWRDRVKP